MKKSELRQIIKEEIFKVLNEEYEVGDSVNIDAKEFPNYKFPYGTSGIISSIDKADHASENLVYSVKLKYIDSQGDVSNELYIDSPRMIK